MKMETLIKIIKFARHQGTTIFAICILLILVVAAFAQSDSSEACKKEKETRKAMARSRARARSAARIATAPKVLRLSGSGTNGIGSSPGAFVVRDEISSEKSLAVHPKVVIQLCVSRGKVKVNGWKRNEIRAFVEKGSPVGFKVLEWTESGKKRPAWVQILGHDPKRPKLGPVRLGKCLSGKTIELDVPFNTSIKIEGRPTETKIDSVRTAEVGHLSGDIYVSNVKHKVDARTYKGNITVRNSRGRIDTFTNAGNIVGYKTRSNEIGDYFKAKTRDGMITLQSVGQRQVEANSSSGAIKYVGRTARGGQYRFITTTGLISLALPSNTSCNIEADYGGSFGTELPLKNINKITEGLAKSIVGRLGNESNCQLRFTTLYGNIRIHRLIKRKPEVATIN